MKPEYPVEIEAVDYNDGYVYLELRTISGEYETYKLRTRKDSGDFNKGDTLSIGSEQIIHTVKCHWGGNVK